MSLAGINWEASPIQSGMNGQVETSDRPSQREWGFPKDQRKLRYAAPGAVAQLVRAGNS